MNHLKALNRKAVRIEEYVRQQSGPPGSPDAQDVVALQRGGVPQQPAAAHIPLAGVFQVFDGIQVVSIGILRGVADTRWPMVVNILGFWLIGLPVSLWLGFRSGLGPRGLWWGLVLGLALVALMLLLRARNRLGGPMQRVLIDHEEGDAVERAP